MAEAKTKPTAQNVDDFVNKITNAGRRDDCRAVIKVMKAATKANPVMWGPSIVGFGIRSIEYAGGRTGDWPVIALSPRKQNLTLYVPGLAQFGDLLQNLGRHSTSKGCLYIKRLADTDKDVLKKLVEQSVAKVNKNAKPSSASPRPGSVAPREKKAAPRNRPKIS
jgi:hypothetical protein